MDPKDREYWREVWERKGNLETGDFKVLDGSERHPRGLDRKIVDSVVTHLSISQSDKVLEVGCGAGMLAQHLMHQCHYVGVDYSSSLVRKHIALLGNEVVRSEANNLPFEDRSFDKVFSWGVFLYLGTPEYASEVIDEMARVCKPEGSIYIGDLTTTSHRSNHLLFRPSQFKGTILQGLWKPSEDEERFEVILDPKNKPLYVPKK